MSTPTIGATFTEPSQKGEFGTWSYAIPSNTGHMSFGSNPPSVTIDWNSNYGSSDQPTQTFAFHLGSSSGDWSLGAISFNNETKESRFLSLAGTNSSGPDPLSYDWGNISVVLQGHTATVSIQNKNTTGADVTLGVILSAEKSGKQIQESDDPQIILMSGTGG